MPNLDESSKGMPAAGKRRDPFYQAQAILSRRDHAEAEVRRKLRQKGFSPQHVEVVIGRLKDTKLINDEAFAQTYVESTLRSKAVGPRWLTLKLRQRGVAAEIVARAVAEGFKGEREKELLHRAAQARRFPLDNPGNQRLQRFLLARGFSTVAVTSYLDDLRRRS